MEEAIPGLGEMLELEAKLLAEGKSQAEVDVFMLDLRTLGMEQASAEMREAGVSDEEIAAFWASLTFGDEHEDDAFDAVDD